MSAKLFFIDTSAWIEYLKKTAHPLTKQIELALFLNTAATRSEEHTSELQSPT